MAGLVDTAQFQLRVNIAPILLLWVRVEFICKSIQMAVYCCAAHIHWYETSVYVAFVKLANYCSVFLLIFASTRKAARPTRARV